MKGASVEPPDDQPFNQTFDPWEELAKMQRERAAGAVSARWAIHGNRGLLSETDPARLQLVE